MSKLELTDDESRVLSEILAGYADELRTEIADTDDRDFRDALRLKAATVGELLARLARA